MRARKNKTFALSLRHNQKPAGSSSGGFFVSRLASNFTSAQFAVTVRLAAINGAKLAMADKRYKDGSAGDVDYGEIGSSYARYRQPEPIIASQIWEALGNATTVLNVGAGTGSYEPTDRNVTAVEPSAAMRAQRPAHLSFAIDATAEALPFNDDSFDASMATVTVHQWTNLEKGLSEMRRVTRGPVVLLVCDPTAMADYWLNDCGSIGRRRRSASCASSFAVPRRF